MRRALLPLLIVACIVIAATLAWFTLNRVRTPAIAPATTTLETRSVAPFHRIEVSGTADVTLVQGDAESVEMEVPAGHAIVDAAVRDGTLVVAGRDRSRSFLELFGSGAKHRSPRITIRFRSLDAIALSGAVRLDAGALRTDSLRIAASGGSSLRIDELDATRLRVSGSGALDARISGRVVDESVAISGAGAYRADRLHADHASVDVSGVGNVVLYADKTLNATISGAGSIEYLGNPEVSQHVSGIGRVRRRDRESSTGSDAGSAGQRRLVAAAAGDARQCSAAESLRPASLNSRRSPVVASTSACTPGSTRISPTRQSTSSETSIAATVCTVSYG